MTVRSGIYRHYKGQSYQVVALARHSETEEELVVYRCLYGDFSWWVRPATMFAEQVEVAGEQLPRFEWQSDAPHLDQLVELPQ